jgi:hypothetical protein
LCDSDLSCVDLTAHRQPSPSLPPSLLSTLLVPLHLLLFDDCILQVFIFALRCLVGDFRRDKQSPTTEHTSLRAHQVLHLASHYTISLAAFAPFRRALRVFHVVIFVLRCLGGPSSTPASAPTNDKSNRRRDSKLNPPSHFPASLMSSSGLPADSGRDSRILLETTLSPPALVLPLASSWLSAHQHDHQRPTRDLPTLSSVVPS